MATVVLVHGAWGGAHGFRHVRKLLRDAGHEVSTPSLTGIGERRTPQPAACFSEEVHLAQELEIYAFTRSYIKATRSAPDDRGEAAFRRAAQRARQSPDWSYYEIDTNHMVASNRPQETASLLARIAEGA